MVLFSLKPGQRRKPVKKEIHLRAAFEGKASKTLPTQLLEILQQNYLHQKKQ
jgi:hypothetical protein